MKERKVFICTNCGNNSSKWEGKCSSCHEWNTYQEETINKESSSEKKKKTWQGASMISHKPILIQDIKHKSTPRLPLEDDELSRSLGGGIVAGSIVLIGGEPGIGKSTLLLQLAIKSQHKVLYVSGEESAEQIKMRALRIGLSNQSCHILTETNLTKILKQAQEIQPDIIVIDSIQTINSPHIDSTPGSLTQVRECTSDLQVFAKESNIPVFIIGHINKEGHIAGPKILEHIVDTVLQFEGDRNHIYRILRTKKK